jgi:hypothetical protein
MPKPFPSLFGRLTAIAREHERLAPTLGLVREMSSALRSGNHPRLRSELHPAPLMAALYAELSAHFSAEEGPQYFGAIRAEGPDLARRVETLVDEHASMLETAAELVELARDPPQAEQLSTRALDLLERLARHERAETALMGGYLEHDSPRFG